MNRTAITNKTESVRSIFFIFVISFLLLTITSSIWPYTSLLSQTGEQSLQAGKTDLLTTLYFFERCPPNRFALIILSPQAQQVGKNLGFTLIHISTIAKRSQENLRKILLAHDSGFKC